MNSYDFNKTCIFVECSFIVCRLLTTFFFSLLGNFRLLWFVERRKNSTHKTEAKRQYPTKWISVGDKWLHFFLSLIMLPLLWTSNRRIEERYSKATNKFTISHIWFYRQCTEIQKWYDEKKNNAKLNGWMAESGIEYV